jgi:hypothetical protein
MRGTLLKAEQLSSDNIKTVKEDIGIVGLWFVGGIRVREQLGKGAGITHVC